MKRIIQRTKKQIPELTPRQTQVLLCLADGQSDKAIGRTLGIEAGTVKIHVKAILSRLNLGGRVQAAVYAVRSGSC